MAKFKIDYTPNPTINPLTGKLGSIYKPEMDLMITGPNRKPVTIGGCLIDTGAAFNVFPAEIAKTLLGMSDKSLKKGKQQKLLGIGGKISIAYGHKIRFTHAYFTFDTYVFFLENQSVPLLGMHGFIDKFKSITLSTETSRIVFETQVK